jgi:hypothetical protein
MKRAAIFALAAAPIVVVGAGVVAARVIPFWPFRLLERGYQADEANTSCIEQDEAVLSEGETPAFSKEVDGDLDPWRVEVYADAPDCVSFDVFNLLGRAQCTVHAPAQVIYRSEAGERAFRIESVGEHRVRASRHGLSCRPMN